MKAVVFDWDGTLVDSQTAYVTSWQLTLNAIGYTATGEDLQYVIGRAFPDSLQYFAALTSIDPESFERAWREDFSRRLDEEITVYADAVECAHAFVDLGIPLAIATQTPRPEFERAFTITGLAGLTNTTVCRTDVDRPKPAPDLYLEACQRLKVDPSDCLAVEDSPVGVQSARDAGLTVVGIARTAKALTSLETTADFTVTTLDTSEMLKYFRVCHEKT
jgi:beta-phosphoglucomutase-like phosphatase (HAD superfamily)